MSLTEQEKKQLSRLSNPDYAVPGSGYDSLRSGITLAPTPGTNSTVDLFNATRQLLYESTKAMRTDDGFRGERSAKVLHVEQRKAIAIPDKKFVAELIDELPEDQREAAMQTITVIYAIPAGGVSAMNKLPENITFSEETESPGDADLQKLYAYPRFYAFGHQVGEVPEINPGDYVYVEIRDYVEYSYGVFKRFHASSPIAAQILGPDGEAIPGKVNPNSVNFNSETTQYPIPEEFKTSLGDGEFVGTSKYKEFMTTAMTEDMKKANENLKGDGFYGSISQQMRSDILPHMENAKQELAGLGVGWYAVGGLVRPASQAQRAARGKRGGSPLSLHFLGRAFDFHTGIGCMSSWKNWSALKKNNYDADLTPGWKYYIQPNGHRRYIVWGLSSDPLVARTEILACFQGYSYQDPAWCQKVTGRFINITAVLAKHGFQPIRQHAGMTIQDDLEAECMGPNGSASLHEGGIKSSMSGPKAKKWGNVYTHNEWWHFQFTSDLVKGKTTWGSQLTAIYDTKTINAAFGPPANTRFWKRRVKHWADPSATYGTHWG